MNRYRLPGPLCCLRLLFSANCRNCCCYRFSNWKEIHTGRFSDSLPLCSLAYTHQGSPCVALYFWGWRILYKENTPGMDNNKDCNNIRSRIHTCKDGGHNRNRNDHLWFSTFCRGLPFGFPFLPGPQPSILPLLPFPLLQENNKHHQASESFCKWCCRRRM